METKTIPGPLSLNLTSKSWQIHPPNRWLGTEVTKRETQESRNHKQTLCSTTSDSYPVAIDVFLGWEKIEG